MELKEGLVIKTINYQDNAKIIYLITDEGKKSIIVKGATNMKSHTFSYAQELTHLAFDTKDKYLSTGKIINSFINIKNDFKKLESCLLILEITYDLIDHINNYNIFYYFLLEILNLMNNTNNHELLELIFRVKILYLLGVAPVFTECVDCKTKENLLGFSFYDGGMKCKDHLFAGDNVVDHNTINLLKYLYISKLNKLSLSLDEVDFSYNEANLFLNSYYDYYLGFKSRVERVLSKFK